MKRVIEITAKSQDEVRALAKQELKPGERIVAENILSAPTRGIFGVVGTPEVKISFTLENSPVEKAPEVVVEAKDSTFAEKDFVDEGEVSQTASAFNPQDEKEYLNADPAKPVSNLVIKDHPGHELILEIVRKVAGIVDIPDLTIDERVDNGYWVIDVQHKLIAQFIGKHGKTLDALQYVLNIIANKGQATERVRILLDAQGYRDQRFKGLLMLANRMYRKALDSGQQVELEPMSTIDRRTIHLALKDRPGVETFSRGIEPMRRVVISPRRNHAAKPPQFKAPAGKAQGPVRAVPVFMEDDNTED
ncbi:MAG: KH domain-containing protein [Candidatus Riflebacteria bacterium]|nr:KH domain-containing protein [Candidatus Riflebacteria bacterium]